MCSYLCSSECCPSDTECSSEALWHGRRQEDSIHSASSGVCCLQTHLPVPLSPRTGQSRIHPHFDLHSMYCHDGIYIVFTQSIYQWASNCFHTVLVVMWCKTEPFVNELLSQSIAWWPVFMKMSFYWWAKQAHLFIWFFCILLACTQLCPYRNVY